MVRRVFSLSALLVLTGCASSADGPLRVLVYNIHAGKDAGGVDNLERVAALIGEMNAGIVLLQEVDRGTRRSGGVDQLEMLMRLTGMHGAFGRSLDYQGGQYGIAILSRWPIVHHETVPLHLDPPQPRAGASLEPRVALFAEVRMPREVVAVANTHFDASVEDTWRRQEAARLLAAISGRGREALLVGGDFNATPESAVVETLRAAGLRDGWSGCGRDDGRTYPADQPVKRIDYLFLTGRARCLAARVIATNASDHRPLLVDVR